jgi:hypothetical protein
VSTSNTTKTVVYEYKKSEVYIKSKRKFIPLSEYKDEIKEKTKIYDDEQEEIGVYYQKNNKKKNSKSVFIQSGKAKGAFVKVPKFGLHRHACVIDLQSLYPSLIMMANISPETQIYEVVGWDEISLGSKLVTLDKLDVNLDWTFWVEYLELNPINVGIFDDIEVLARLLAEKLRYAPNETKRVVASIL